MTAEEKAKELVEKYENQLLDITDVITMQDAKQCAIICVEQMLKISPAADAFNPWREEQPSLVDYWNEVLTHLKK